MLKLVGCLGKMFVSLLLLGIIVLALMRGPELLDLFRSEGINGGAPGVVIDEALASEALERYWRAVEGDSGSVAFSGEEIEAVLRYRFADRLPRGGGDPTVRISAGEVMIRASFSRDSIPLPENLERGRSILPQRVPISVRGTVLATDTGPTFLVRRVDVAYIPIPHRISEEILQHLRGEITGPLPPSAFPIRLPPEAGEVYIDGNYLVLGSLP